MIVSSPKYNVQEHSKSSYEIRMSVIVRKFQKEDVGSYRCIAKNSLGEVDSSIRLYGEYCVGWDGGIFVVFREWL
jgi:Immunoglobulin I-set domain